MIPSGNCKNKLLLEKLWFVAGKCRDVDISILSGFRFSWLLMGTFGYVLSSSSS